MKNTSGEFTHPVTPRVTSRSRLPCDNKSPIGKNVSSRSSKYSVSAECVHPYFTIRCPVTFNHDFHVLSAEICVLSGCIYHEKQLFFSVWISLTQNIALGNELLFPGYIFMRKWERAHVVTRRGFWCFHLLVSQKYQETGLFRDRYHWKKKKKPGENV